MATNRLFNVLDAITDSSCDYTSDMLTDASKVIDYADAGGIQITHDEALLIIKVGNKWLHDIENGNGEWSRMRYEAQEALTDISHV